MAVRAEGAEEIRGSALPRWEDRLFTGLQAAGEGVTQPGQMTAARAVHGASMSRAAVPLAELPVVQPGRLGTIKPSGVVQAAVGVTVVLVAMVALAGSQDPAAVVEEARGTRQVEMGRLGRYGYGRRECG